MNRINYQSLIIDVIHANTYNHRSLNEDDVDTLAMTIKDNISFSLLSSIQVQKGVSSYLGTNASLQKPGSSMTSKKHLPI